MNDNDEIMLPAHTVLAWWLYCAALVWMVAYFTKGNTLMGASPLLAERRKIRWLLLGRKLQKIKECILMLGPNTASSMRLASIP